MAYTQKEEVKGQPHSEERLRGQWLINTMSLKVIPQWWNEIGSHQKWSINHQLQLQWWFFINNITLASFQSYRVVNCYYITRSSYLHSWSSHASLNTTIRASPSAIRHVSLSIIRHGSLSVIRHASLSIVRHTSLIIVCYASLGIGRHASLSTIRYTSPSVVRLVSLNIVRHASKNT